MRAVFLSLLLLIAGPVWADFDPPAGFRRIPGENRSGEDDEYTNGRYTFCTHKLFRDYDFKGVDAGVQGHLARFFGFPFYRTKDRLCWGTGKKGAFYAYVVVAYDAEVIELYSRYNDAGFSQYSKWLLRTARAHQQARTSLVFPMQAN